MPFEHSSRDHGALAPCRFSSMNCPPSRREGTLISQSAARHCNGNPDCKQWPTARRRRRVTRQPSCEVYKDPSATFRWNSPGAAVNARGRCDPVVQGIYRVSRAGLRRLLGRLAEHPAGRRPAWKVHGCILICSRRTDCSRAFAQNTDAGKQLTIPRPFEDVMICLVVCKLPLVKSMA